MRWATGAVSSSWRVQKALDAAGITYEVVPGPWRPKNRTSVIEGTGQPLYRTIRGGRLMEKQHGRGVAATP